MGRMLVAENDDRTAWLVGRALRDAGHSVVRAAGGDEALLLALRDQFDLVLLDLRLPRIGGMEVLTRIVEARPGQHIFVLSGFCDVETRVACLDAGAADVLLKPFSVAELLARVRARMRLPVPAAADPCLVAGPVRLDLRLRRVTVDGHEVILSMREFLLLQFLITRAGLVCSRAQLLTDVWGLSFDPGSNVVDVCIRRLRAKLDSPERVETVRKVGYRLIKD